MVLYLQVINETFAGGHDTKADTSKELLAHLDRFNG